MEIATTVITCTFFTGESFYSMFSPCGSSQALIKQNVVQLPPSLGASTLLHAPAVAEEPEKAKRPRFPKPDVDQLLPFKPRAIVRKLRAVWRGVQA